MSELVGSRGGAVAGRLPDPPGPAGLPWFGSLRELRANPMHFYARLARDHGGVVRFLYGKKPTFLVSEPALIKELLVDRRKNYVKNQRYKALQRAIGEGLLLSEGNLWKRQRRASQPGFNPRLINQDVPRTVERIEEALDRWEPYAESGEPVDIAHNLSRLTQTLVGDRLLGPSNLDLVERVIEVKRRLEESWPTPPKGLFGGLKPPSPVKVLRLRKCLADLDACFFEAIRRQRQTGEDDGSLLAILAHHSENDGGERFSDQELRDQLITLYMAGFETSESALTFLFYRLSLSPEIAGRLEAEVDEVLGGRLPTADDLPRLDYAKRCFQEILRIYPPAYNFSRIAQEDDELGGYHIPAGHMVIVSPYATHRLARYWPNPEGFDPDRFTAASSADRPGFAYIPFGAGHRACIGANLAMVQGTLMVAQIARRFRLDLVPGHPVEEVPGTVMRSRFGMRMTVRRR